MAQEMTMADIKVPSERHYKYHRRQWQLYLLFCSLMAIGTIFAVLIPGEQPELVLAPTAVVFTLMFALHLVVRGRNATEYKEELTRILQDEWFATSANRSYRVALATVIFAQVPLMFFVAYVPREPTVEGSVLGMGMMTTALGCGAFAAIYLFHSRAGVDE